MFNEFINRKHRTSDKIVSFGTFLPFFLTKVGVAFLRFYEIITPLRKLLATGLYKPIYPPIEAECTATKCNDDETVV